MRVCQFRHDGKWTVITAAGKLPSGRPASLFYRGGLRCQTKLARSFPRPELVKNKTDSRMPKLGAAQEIPEAVAGSPHRHPSFASIVIFAFSTFDTGHPFSAASAYF